LKKQVVKKEGKELLIWQLKPGACKDRLFGAKNLAGYGAQGLFSSNFTGFESVGEINRPLWK